jgi:hypothetical protein
MNKTLFWKIMDTFVAHDFYFSCRWNVLRLQGLTNIQNCIATLWMFAYEVVIDAIDEYCKLGESQVWAMDYSLISS